MFKKLITCLVISPTLGKWVRVEKVSAFPHISRLRFHHICILKLLPFHLITKLIAFLFFNFFFLAKRFCMKSGPFQFTTDLNRSLNEFMISWNWLWVGLGIGRNMPLHCSRPIERICVNSYSWRSFWLTLIIFSSDFLATSSIRSSWHSTLSRHILPFLKKMTREEKITK